MDQKTIYSKTGKGVLEIKNKAGKLSKDLVRVLTLIDGKSTVADVVAKSKFNAPEIARFIKQLEDAGFIKEFTNPSSSSYDAAPAGSSYVDDLDFTASLPPGKRIYQSGQAEFRQQESEARMKAEAEAKRKREAEENRRREEAERAARDEAARMAKIEAERKAREAAAVKARQEAERKAKLQAEEMAQTTRDLSKVLEAERKALEAGDLKKKEESARKAAEEAQHKVAADADRLKREADERRQREEQERKRRDEEEARKRREEEERKRKEEEERKRREEEEARRRREEEERKRKEEEERRRREEEEARRRKEDEERKRREEEERKRREEEEARRRKEDEERKRKEEEERKRREEEEARRRKEEEERERREEEERRQREEEERKLREEEDRRRAEEDARRREEDERRSRQEEERRRREDGDSRVREEEETRLREKEEARRREEERAREQEEERRRQEAAAVSVDLKDFDLPTIEESGSFLESFERQQEALKKQAAEEERQRREREEARAAAERAERQEEARQEAERRAAEEAERRDRVEREESERRERERRKAEEYERKIEQEEERKRKAAEEKQRAEAARIENERRAREEALARKRKEAEERERKARELKALGKQGKVRSPLDRLKPVAIGVVALAAVLVGAIQFMPMSGYIPSVEKLASGHIQEPVSIQSMSVSVLSGLQINLQNVKIGTTQDVSFNSVTLSPDFGSLFGDRKVIRAIRAEGGSFAKEVLARLPDWLSSATADKSVQIGTIELAAIKPDMRAFELPPMNAEIRLNPDQSIAYARIGTSDGKISAEITPADGLLQVAITASNWTPPVGPSLEIVDLSAKGVATADSLRLTEWDARLYEGAAKGTAEISWSGGWAASSEFEFARLQIARLLAVYTRTARTSGLAEGRGSISMRADSLPSLFDSPRADIAFTVRRGDLDGVDLVRALQAGREGTQGGSTKFEELSGTLELANGRYQYRNVQLGAGILTASGNFDIARNQDVSGRVYVELRSQAQQLRNNLNVTGSLQGILLRP